MGNCRVRSENTKTFDKSNKEFDCSHSVNLDCRGLDAILERWRLSHGLITHMCASVVVSFSIPRHNRPSQWQNDAFDPFCGYYRHGTATTLEKKIELTRGDMLFYFIQVIARSNQTIVAQGVVNQ